MDAGQWHVTSHQAQWLVIEHNNDHMAISWVELSSERTNNFGTIGEFIIEILFHISQDISSIFYLHFIRFQNKYQKYPRPLLFVNRFTIDCLIFNNTHIFQLCDFIYTVLVIQT